MGFTEFVKRTVTGMDATERAQDRAARAEIRRKQLAAYYEAKQKESIALARTKAKYEREARERQLKQKYLPAKPKSYSTPFSGGGTSSIMGSFGNTSFNPLTGYQSPKPKLTATAIPRRRRKKRSRIRTRVVYRNVPVNQPYPYVKVI